MTLCIIGSGLAGYTLAREFRARDKTTPLHIFTQDGGEFYSKPQLSSSCAHQKSPDELPLSSAAALATQWSATIHTHTDVTAIDTAGKHIHTATQSFPYAQCVLALGAEPILPLLSGNALSHVYTVNQLDDYRRFRAAIEGKSRIAIIGAGLVGCEFANDLRAAKKEVTVIAMGRAPLELCAPTVVGEALEAALAHAGVTWHWEETVVRVDHAASGVALTLASGRVVEADVVLSAIGIRPSLTLARQAGLSIGRGILVDEYFETSATDVFALGDCAQQGGIIRPFIAPIFSGAKTLAATLTGTRTPIQYPPMPIVVKTPLYPVTVVAPMPGVMGEWKTVKTEEGIRAVYVDAAGAVRGFALTAGCVKERMALLSTVVL